MWKDYPSKAIFWCDAAAVDERTAVRELPAVNASLHAASCQGVTCQAAL